MHYSPTVGIFGQQGKLRDWLNKGLELVIEKKQAHREMSWLADLRQGDAQSDADLEWIATDWNIRALEANIRYVAFVLPEDDYALTQMNAETYSELSDSNANRAKMVTRMFKDEELAKAWLRDILSRE